MGRNLPTILGGISGKESRNFFDDIITLLRRGSTARRWVKTVRSPANGKQMKMLCSSRSHQKEGSGMKSIRCFHWNLRNNCSVSDKPLPDHLGKSETLRKEYEVSRRNVNPGAWLPEHSALLIQLSAGGTRPKSEAKNQFIKIYPYLLRRYLAYLNSYLNFGRRDRAVVRGRAIDLLRCIRTYQDGARLTQLAAGVTRPWSDIEYRFTKMDSHPPRTRALGITKRRSPRFTQQEDAFLRVLKSNPQLKPVIADCAVGKVGPPVRYAT